jgi:hypothetical protein
MSRRYADVVAVQRRDTVPSQFLWRGRLYLVRTVLAHWVESGDWWRSAAAAAGDLAAEREFWRVEAGSGRTDGVGIYDLCFDWVAGDWTVVATVD